MPPAAIPGCDRVSQRLAGRLHPSRCDIVFLSVPDGPNRYDREQSNLEPECRAPHSTRLNDKCRAGNCTGSEANATRPIALTGKQIDG
jgi:hypothetical protein